MKEIKTHYYKVVAKCGHVGRKNYIPIAFAIIATSKKEAAAIARELPRVKHQHKDAIIEVKELSYDEFIELRNINNNDEYLKCKSKQEQKLRCDLTDRIMIDTHNARTIHDKEKRKERIKFKMKKQKELEKVYKNGRLRYAN